VTRLNKTDALEQREIHRTRIKNYADPSNDFLRS